MGANKGTILIVEDDDATRDSVVELVGHEGFMAIGVRDGREALTALKDGPSPSAVLLDMMLPDVNGWQFLKEKAANPRLASIPVIVFTAGYTAPFDVEHVIVKPLSTIKLRRALTEVLGVRFEQ